jgi:hypothetical protein
MYYFINLKTQISDQKMEEFRQQVFEIRDRYHDDMMETFLGFYRGGIEFAISINHQPDEIYPLDLAIEKFKKSIGDYGYKVIQVRIDNDLHDTRFTIQRKDYETIQRRGYVTTPVKPSKCIIS